jgi:DNA-nicking Smr family endonuclease
LNKKLSNKDKKDWKNFLSSKDKIYNKDLYLSKKNSNKELIKTIDLHGSSLENANKVINDFIKKCFHNNIDRIIVITGKGLRSNNIDNPYVSKDLSILKYSVPEYIKSNINLMKMIKNIEKANIKDGGSGAFNIYLKKIKE